MAESYFFPGLCRNQEFAIGLLEGTRFYRSILTGFVADFFNTIGAEGTLSFSSRFW